MHTFSSPQKTNERPVTERRSFLQQKTVAGSINTKHKAELTAVGFAACHNVTRQPNGNNKWRVLANQRETLGVNTCHVLCTTISGVTGYTTRFLPCANQTSSSTYQKRDLFDKESYKK